MAGLVAMSGSSQALLDSLNKAERTRMTALTKTETELTRKQTALNGLKKEVQDFAGTRASFTKAADHDGLKAALNSFVKEYNESNAALRRASAKGADFQTDSSVRTTVRRLDDAVRSTAGGDLRALGISINRDGSLSLDESKLKTLTDAGFDAAKTLASDAVGRVADAANSVTGLGQGLMALEDRLDRTLKRVQQDKDREQTRLDRADVRNRMQVAAMEQALSAINGNSYSAGSFFNTQA